MEFSGNPTGNIFLASSMDLEYLISYKGNKSHLSNNSIESTKSNYVEYPIKLMQTSSPIPRDSSHPTYNAEKQRCTSRVFNNSNNGIKDLCKRYYTDPP